MGCVELNIQGEVAVFNLYTSTSIGRHWSNSVVLTNPDIPLYWLEIRWKQDGWCWRALNSDFETKGMGHVLLKGWRGLSENQTIRLNKDISIRCIKNEPPELIVFELDSKQQHLGPSVYKYIEISDTEEYFTLGSLEEGNALKNGEYFTVQGTVFRLHCPTLIEQTEPLLLDISEPTVWLKINLARQTAIFGNEYTQVHLEGSTVLVLYVYAEAVMGTYSWRTVDEVYQRWVEVGGNAKSLKSRINWERGKIRNRLRDLGVSGVKQLFLKKSIEGVNEFRLALTKSQITLERSAEQD